MAKIIPREALSLLAPALLAMDSQAAVKKRAARLKALDHSAEAAVTVMSLQGPPDELQDLPADSSEKKIKKGCKILLLVKDSSVCRQAFRLCTSMIGRQEGDSLLIMTLKEPTAYGVAEGQKLLRSFSHIT